MTGKEVDMEVKIDKPLGGVTMNIEVVKTRQFWFREKLGIFLLHAAAWVLGVDDVEITSSTLNDEEQEETE